MKVKISIIALLALLVLGFYGAYNPAADISEVIEKYRYPESQFINISGLNVHYYEKGHGDETLVFLHGNGANTRHYDELIDKLSLHYRVVIMDYLGHGLTGAIDNNFSNQAFIHFFETFFDHLGLNQFHIAGHSMGGYWSLLYAQKNARRIKKILLISSYGGICENRSYDSFFVPEQIPFMETLSRYFFPRFMVEKTLKSYVYNSDSISEKMVSTHFDLMSIRNNRSYRKYFFSHPHMRTAIDDFKFQHDIYLLFADKDRVHDLCELENLKSRFPIKSMKILENTGHLAAIEKPQETAEILLQFLRD